MDAKRELLQKGFIRYDGVDYIYDDDQALWVVSSIYKHAMRLPAPDFDTKTDKARYQSSMRILADEVGAECTDDAPGFDPPGVLPFDFHGNNTLVIKTNKIRGRTREDMCTETLVFDGQKVDMDAVDALMRWLYPTQCAWLAGVLFDFITDFSGRTRYLYSCPIADIMIRAMQKLCIRNHVVSRSFQKIPCKKVMYIDYEAEFNADLFKFDVIIRDPTRGRTIELPDTAKALNHASLFLWIIKTKTAYDGSPFPQGPSTRLDDLRQAFKLAEVDNAVKELIQSDSEMTEEDIAKKTGLPPRVVELSIRRLMARYM